MARGDLSNQKWAKLKPLLPPEHSGNKGRPYVGHRKTLNGILWRLRTGCPWRDIPKRYGHHQTIYDRYVRFKNNGLWSRILQALQADADARAQLDWEMGSVDGTVIRAHQHSAGAARLSPHATQPPQLLTPAQPTPPAQTSSPQSVAVGFMSVEQVQEREALGYSRGGFSTKVHLVVDRKGRPLAAKLSPGQAHQSRHLADTLDAIRVPRPGRGRPKKRMKRLAGDRAFNGKPTRQVLRRRRIRAIVPPRADDRACRKRRGQAGGRPYSLDAALYRERNVVERCFARLKQFRAVATRYDKLAVNYLTGVSIALIICWLS